VNGPAKATLVALVAALAAVIGSGCGEHGVQVKGRGAQLFAERCGGCHTLSAAGTEGSISGTRPTGPNLDQRHEIKDGVLFAIKNGGFSGAIMPQNVVVGKDAEDVAAFVAKYAGRSAKAPPSPNTAATGTTGASAK
jgi:mono/diheme cytochrome c family protein